MAHPQARRRRARHQPAPTGAAAGRQPGQDQDGAEAEHEYGFQVLAVGHRQFAELGEAGIKALGQPGAVVYDVKRLLPLGAADGRL